ncbi:MAG TPA: 3-deoxy-D-manno-octulosonic acid transferase [Thermoanaerobaculia bacterium]|nr:3-deoxy-D-manno-octulosonic acid transferase [Thermoanaerobaculia bacterium]
MGFPLRDPPDSAPRRRQLIILRRRMGSLLWLVYEAGLGLALLIAGPILLARRGRHYLPTLAGRLGGAGPGEPDSGATAGGLWLHAVSVGEVGVAATLVRALPPELPLLVTTVTPTGQALARRAFAGRARVAYLPFDLRPAVARFWRRFTPAALVLVEGDYWPLLLREARRHALPVAVINGRVGDRSFRRMRRVRPLARFLFSGIERFGVQSAEDRGRLQALGVDPARIIVTGNLKFETPEPRANPDVAVALERLAGGRPVVIAGSTMQGEDEQVLAAFGALGGGRRALLVLAPRHPERWDEVERLLAASGLVAMRRSRLPVPAARDAPDVLLLDSMGEMASLFQHAAAAFIGGTLVGTGGHNPLEAARYGIPIAVGPSMQNFRDMAERFDAAGAWRRVADGAELGRVWGEWLADPAAARAQGERAAALLVENRGALARTLEMLAPILARVAPGAGPDAQAEAGGG